MASKLITIRGKVVDYRPKAINQIYGLLNHDIKAFTNKDCESGTWLASKICPDRNVPWATTKTKIYAHTYEDNGMDVDSVQPYFPKWEY